MLHGKLGRNSSAIELTDLKPFLAVLAALGWWVLPKTVRRIWLPLGASLTVVAVVEVAAFIMSRNGQYNLWLYNCFFAVELPFGVWILRSITRSERLRLAALWALLPSLAITVQEFRTSSIQDGFLEGIVISNSILLTVLFTWALFHMALQELDPLPRSPRFWVAFAFVLFYGCTLPITGLFSSLTTRNPVLADRLYILNDIPFALYYLLLCWVFFRLLRRPIPDAR